MIMEYGNQQTMQRPWDKIPFGINDGVFQYQPMDLEIDPNNKIWVSTTTNHQGAGGGSILVANSDISAFL